MALLWPGGTPNPKLTVPVPPAAALPRPRLEQQMLDAAPALWVGSPAASGKTVLAASALRRGGKPCCWYQVDRADSDPGAFFHFLGQAVMALGPRRRGSPLPLYGREVGEQLLDFARAWSRAALALLPPHTVLVLDDWHWISEASPVQQLLATLLDQLPPGCQLWVLSRHAAPATLDVARLRGRLSTMDFGDLALTREEVQALMRGASGPSAGATDGPERSELWLRWCEGWVGALVFALATGRREPAALPAALPADASAAVFGFLSAELFEHTSPALQAFMLTTAWLPFVTEALVRQALPGAETQDAIAQLVHRGLLQASSRGQERSWGYHRLLRDFLRQRSRKQWPSRTLAQTLAGHARALERAGLPEAAADLWQHSAALDADAWPELAALLLRHAPALNSSGRYATLEGWAQALPEAQRTPWVDFWWAQALLARDARLGYLRFEKAFAGFWREGDADGLYRSWCGVIEGITYACDDYGALELWLLRLRELRQRFPRYPSLLVRAQVSVFGFSATFFLRPQAPEFAPWLRNVRRLYRLALRRADRLAIGGLLGLYHASITGMDALGAHLRQLRPLLDDDTVPPFYRLVGGLSDVIHHWIAGSTNDALARLACYARLASATGAHAIDRQFAFHHVYVHCLRGELQQAEHHLQGLAPHLPQLGQIDVAQFHFLCGWHAALAGGTGEAVHLLEIAYDHARTRRFALFEACSRGLLAELLATSGDSAAARRHAEGALGVANEMGSVTARVACQMQRAAVAELAGSDAAAMAPLIAQAFGDARRHGHWAWGGLYPPTLARLAWRALALNVETEYALELIRRRGLAPPPGADATGAWPWPLKLRGFGGFGVWCEGQALRQAAERPLDVLRALLASAPAPLPVQQALQWLWPDSTAADQRKAFDVALLRLRRLLGDTPWLRLEGGMLLADACGVWSDVATFARVLDQATAPELHATPERAPEHARTLLALYRGPLLPQVNTSWAQAARGRWRQRWALAVGATADVMAMPDPAAALAMLEAAFDRDPAAQGLARRLMRWYSAAGQSGEAQRSFGQCWAAVMMESGLPPAPETRALAAELGLGPPPNS